MRLLGSSNASTATPSRPDPAKALPSPGLARDRDRLVQSLVPSPDDSTAEGRKGLQFSGVAAATWILSPKPHRNPQAMTSALTNSSTFSAPCNSLGADVDLPAPFGPARTTTSGDCFGIRPFAVCGT